MAQTKLGRIRPIYKGTWSSTTAYTALEIVKNSDGHSAYIALKDVPAGIALTNATYWAAVLDVSEVLNAADAAVDTAVARADAAAREAEAAARLAPAQPLTQTGSPALIWPEVGSPLRPVILMDPVQGSSGDPTPDNVRSITGRSSVSLARYGKNLLDLAANPGSLSNAVSTVIDGGVRITPSKSGSSHSYVRWYTIPVESEDMVGKTFTLSCNAAAGGGSTPRLLLSVYNSGGTNVGTSKTKDGAGRISVSYTIARSDVGKGNRLAVGLYANAPTSATTTEMYSDYANVQLEIGTATGYEPHRGDSYSVNLGQTVYGGRLDVHSGTLTVDRKCVKITSNDVGGRTVESGTQSVFKLNVSGVVSGVSGVKPAYAPGSMCDKYLPAAGLTDLKANDLTFGLDTDNILRIHDSRATSVTEYLTLLDSMGGIEICYMLAEPEVIRLTPTEIVALEGLNTVCSSGEWLEVTYNKSLEHKWYGKKWCVIGDSLTDVTIRTTKNYHDYISQATGITVVNLGVAGTGYAKGADTNKAFLNRLASIPVDCDVVTIFGSGNDMSAGLPLGAPTDTGTETLCGCINTTIDNLIAIMPAVSLGIVSPTPWTGSPPFNTDSGMAKYCAAMKTICENRSIPFLDLYHCSNLRPWTEEGRASCYTKDDGNGVHPDEKGHALIAPRFKAFLETLIL